MLKLAHQICGRSRGAGCTRPPRGRIIPVRNHLRPQPSPVSMVLRSSGRKAMDKVPPSARWNSKRKKLEFKSRCHTCQAWGQKWATSSQQYRDESQDASCARLESKGSGARGRQGAAGTGLTDVQASASRTRSKTSRQGATAVRYDVFSEDFGAHKDSETAALMMARGMARECMWAQQ